MSEQYRQYEDKPNTGVLFRNQDKEGNDPDYKGQCVLEIKGKRIEFWMNAWINESKKGQKYLKFSYREKDKKWVKPTAEEPAAEGAPVEVQSEEDIPF